MPLVKEAEVARAAQAREQLVAQADLGAVIRTNFAVGADIVEAIKLLGLQLGAAETNVITFRKSIPALTADVEDRRIQFNAAIKAAFFHFPPGPNYLVESRLVIISAGAVTPAVPVRENSFIALDNAFIPFWGLHIPVAEGTTLRAEWWNYDGGFSHTVPVTVIIARLP